MSVTIAIILVLVGGASLGIQPYLAYRDGRASGEMLSAVKAAQLMYLSDYPSTPVTSLTQALILPYMPHGTWPTLPLVNGVAPTINCAMFPPVAVLGGTTYDPSGQQTMGSGTRDHSEREKHPSGKASWLVYRGRGMVTD